MEEIKMEEIKTVSNPFARYASEETLAKIVDFKSVGEMWNHCVSTYAELLAVTDGENSYTYAGLEDAVSHVRATLSRNGVQKGDCVAVYMQNSCDFVAAYLGITTFGAVALLLPPQLNDMAVFGCCYKYRAHIVLTSEQLLPNTLQASQKLGVVAVVSKDYAADTFPCVVCEAKDPCVILFTGGTTGKSKGALLNNGAVLRGAKNGCFGYSDVFLQRYLLVLPLTHVFGLIRNLMTSLYTGSGLFICRNNKDMFRDIAMFRPTILVLVPALAEMALNLSKQFGRNMLGDSLKYIICGAATVAPYLVSEYEKFGITLFPGYGLTESANLVSGNPESKIKPGSVGIPYEGQQLRVVDGELWLKGVNMMDGYLNDPEENAAAYTDGWFRTGDLVRFDDEGFMYITGRIKEIIVLPSGENISPAELEALFNEIDIIQDSLVYYSEKDHTLALMVYPRAVMIGNNGITDVHRAINDAVQNVNQTLPSYMRVSKVVIRDTDFVRSPSMKILRGKNGEE